jgi:hypothetical protein
MAGWLSWRCGISPVTAREQVRVARAIVGLPLLRDRFSTGRLSYWQVRAIARVASPATEEPLVELAPVSTAAQLEQITRAYRRTRQASKEAEARRDAGRFFRFGWDDEGNLVGSFKLPAETGALLQATVERAAVDDAHRDGAGDALGAAQVDALVDLVGAGRRRRRHPGHCGLVR